MDEFLDGMRGETMDELDEFLDGMLRLIGNEEARLGDKPMGIVAAERLRKLRLLRFDLEVVRCIPRTHRRRFIAMVIAFHSAVGS